MCVRRAQVDHTQNVWKKVLVTNKVGFLEDALSSKHIRETVKIFEEFHVTIDAMELTRKHIKFFVSKDGHQKVFIRASSPSDSRATANFRGDIRRWLIGAIVETGENNVRLYESR